MKQELSGTAYSEDAVCNGLSLAMLQRCPPRSDTAASDAFEPILSQRFRLPLALSPCNCVSQEHRMCCTTSPSEYTFIA